ncbi:Electron transfer flavoprotein subunit beta [Candidatus Desulfarcum epimagneticum]|uniref:Electron transfer flavoprotein subunit beta n=1 Tax=uncultured Desulfobacteraceae bacterium TaxID=218296 RepID=A0A484HE90_9BACT|nr:Electron transfer flavoprotein subunit beta [uncultured Desulfobacteraceae bacterium]
MPKLDIIVLLNRVPSTESPLEIADDGVSLKLEGVKKTLNPYDEFAVEEALLIREKLGGSVLIVSLGEEKDAEGIQTALAMGADRGILILDPASKEYDSLKIARILARLLKTLTCDLIIAGQRSVDWDTGQIGAAVAEFLGVPNIPMVIKQDIADGSISCVKSVEGGTVTVKAPLPVLITAQRGLNEPRYASLPGIMKAKRKPLEIKTPEEWGLDPDSLGEPLVKTLALKYPPERTGGIIVEGDSDEEKAENLVRALHEKERLF